MNLADSIAVGDVVEFESGSPVIVLSIEDNYSGADRDPSDYAVRTAGKSLVFSCKFDATDPEPNTFYVRRERSRISGDRVWR